MSWMHAATAFAALIVIGADARSASAYSPNESEPTRAAAEALAAKFSGGAAAPSTPDDVAIPLSEALPGEAPQEPDHGPMLAALAESARALVDYSVAATEEREKAAKQRAERRNARTRAERRRMIALQRAIARQERADAAEVSALSGAKAGANRIANVKPDDPNEPSLLAKIFNPANWGSSQSDATDATKQGQRRRAPAAAYSGGQ
ncbi:MAG: hypothetical protein ACT4OU_10140 [Hyphomicrobium sp.]